MPTPPQNHQAIRDLLENALHQVVATQTQVTTIEGQLHEIKSQIDLSLESIDSVLKQLEASERKVEKVRSDVAATLTEMFEQMSRIVNGAREQMMHAHDAETSIQQPDTPDVPVKSVMEENAAESVPETKPLATVDQTPVLPANEMVPDVLNGGEAGQRATASLNEMIATIDESDASRETAPETQIEMPAKETAETPVEAASETQAVVSTETQAAASTETQAAASTETETPKGPGSADSLSALLAKARAASGTTETPVTESAPLVGEEEDAEAVSELLHKTSGSFVAQ